MAKIDIDNECENKSSSYRAIVLINYRDGYCFVLHLYPKKEKENITRAEMNIINALFLAICNQMKEE